MGCEHNHFPKGAPMTLKKIQIAEAIATKLGFPKIKSLETVESLLEIMKGSLESGDDVMITGFGKFCVKKKAERKGRNPYTGKDLMIRPRRVVTFKCSAKLRKMINGQGKKKGSGRG